MLFSNDFINTTFIQSITSDTVEDTFYAHLPENNRNMLLFLIQLVRQLAEFEQITKMGISNISTDDKSYLLINNSDDPHTVFD